MILYLADNPGALGIPHRPLTLVELNNVLTSLGTDPHGSTVNTCAFWDVLGSEQAVMQLRNGSDVVINNGPLVLFF